MAVMDLFRAVTTSWLHGQPDVSLTGPLLMWSFQTLPDIQKPGSQADISLGFKTQFTVAGAMET